MVLFSNLDARAVLIRIVSVLAFTVVSFGAVAAPPAVFGQSPPPGVSCPPDWDLKSVVVFSVSFPDCPGTLVDIIVWYCVPDALGPVFPKEQLVIKGVSMKDGGPLPCPPTGENIRNLGEFIMFVLNPEGWTAPPCDEWCKQHPECFCSTNYPQWVFGNGSCGRMEMVGDTGSVVMCGEVDGQNGTNCYYLYHVCQEGIQLSRTLVGKITPDNCPGYLMPSECSIPLCDTSATVNQPPPDTCDRPDTLQSRKEPDISSVESRRSNPERIAVPPRNGYHDAVIREEE